MRENVFDMRQKRGNDDFIAKKLKFGLKEREIQQEERNRRLGLREL